MSSKQVAEYLAKNWDWKALSKTELIEKYITLQVPEPVNAPMQFFYRHLKQEKPRGVIFLFHGLGSCTTMLGSLANFLSSELQLDVLAFDQIGHGRSSGVINNKTIETPLQEPDVYFPDYKLLYKIGWLFVQALLKQEEARYNKLPVFLFGKSMGGGTILHMLLHTPTPNPVTAVILEAPYIELTHPIPTFAQYALKGVSWVWSTMTVTKPQFDDFSRIPEQVQLRSTHKECYTKGLCAQTANELLAFSQALQQKASEIHFPMLLVHGTDDRTVSVHGSKKLFESNKNPDKEIKIYNGGYHGLTCDLCVREVEQDMKAWIEKHLS